MDEEQLRLARDQIVAKYGDWTRTTSIHLRNDTTIIHRLRRLHSAACSNQSNDPVRTIRGNVVISTTAWVARGSTSQSTILVSDGEVDPRATALWY
jgi:hypothetical protein